MWRRILILLFLLFFSGLVVAQVAGGNDLTVDLAEKSVNITTGFTGANLSLFGVKEQAGDIAIVIEGPSRRMVVRRKGQAAGIWMNVDSVNFLNVPVYYDLALSRAEHDIAAADILREQEIGLDSLNFEPVNREDVEVALRFREALIRNKQAQGHFPLEPKDIIFLSNNFFRANFYMPADVPTGEYIIKTYLFKNGAVLGKRETKLRVGQVGFSARVYRFAHFQGLAYGLLSVALAIVAGGSAWMFLRKD